MRISKSDEICNLHSMFWGDPKLCISLFRGWGRCLKITLQTWLSEKLQLLSMGDNCPSRVCLREPQSANKIRYQVNKNWGTLRGDFLRVFADMCGKKFRLLSIGGGVECHMCADTGARTPIGAIKNSSKLLPDVLETSSYKPSATYIRLCILTFFNFVLPLTNWHKQTQLKHIW